MSKRKDNIGFLVVVLLVAGGLIKTGVDGWQAAKKRLAWPSVRGKVLHSKVSKHVGKAGKDRGVITWFAEITYGYKVTKRDYKGSYTGGYQKYKTDHAKKIVSAFPAGAALKVYYDPNKPDDSTLHKDEALEQQFFWIFAGIVVLLYGAYEFLTNKE